MRLAILHETYAVCKLQDLRSIRLDGEFASLTVTGDEISLVCPEMSAPQNAQAEGGWRAMRVEGTLDFGMVGVISKITGVLAEEDISVFVLSTYDTDYVLVKQDTLSSAVEALEAAGYTVN